MTARLFCFAVLFPLSIAPLWAQAWNPARGDVQIKLSAGIFETDTLFDVNGDTFTDTGTFERKSYDLYAQGGVTDHLALFGSLSYLDLERRVNVSGQTVAIPNKGAGDLELGARYRLLQKGDMVLAVEAMGKFAWLHSDKGHPMFLRGNPQDDYELRLLYGTRLGKYMHAGLEAGYRWRLDDPADQFRYEGRLGASFSKFHVRGVLSGIESREDIVAPDFRGNPTITHSFDLVTLDLALGFQISEQWHVEYSWVSHEEGKNYAAGDHTSLGLIVSF